MSNPKDLLQNLEHLSAPQLKRLLTERLTQQKLGLYWKSSAIERDAALNATRPETVRQHLAHVWEGTEKRWKASRCKKPSCTGKLRHGAKPRQNLCPKRRKMRHHDLSGQKHC